MSPVILERDDRRVLGAIRFVDAVVGTPLDRRFRIERAPLSQHADVLRNRSGFYVVTSTPTLLAHTDAFRTPPPTPGNGTVTLAMTVHDVERRYLPRRFTIRLPRDPSAGNAFLPSSLFQPVTVELFPSPTAPLQPGWAAIRVSVARAGGGAPLPFTYLRVRATQDDRLLARGVTDERGEALLAVTGIPVTSWGSGAGPVTATRLDARLVAYFDRDAFDEAAGIYPDPDSLEANHETLPRSEDVDLELVSGRTAFVRRVDIIVPP
jgi:hypothetical protein